MSHAEGKLMRSKSELNHLISAKLKANCVDFDMEI